MGVCLRTRGTDGEEDNVLDWYRSVGAVRHLDHARALGGQGTKRMGREILIVDVFFLFRVVGSDTIE